MFQKPYNFISTNTILYCRHWEDTVAFYRDALSLKINFMTDWFVEFLVSENTRISIADQRRSSVKTSGSHGITIALQVNQIQSVRNDLVGKRLNPTEIKEHPWKAKVFYVFDPDGRRIEIWQANTN